MSQGIVKFHGFQSDPVPYYENADCVVLASYHEGMSNVLLEGAAIGRPLITSNIHGCKEAVEHDVSGLLCEVKDAESLYQQMKKMLHLTKEERAFMGVQGRRYIESHFDKKMVVANTVAALGLKK